jgi:two-component system, sensor histidine kinase and response regulator
MFLGGNPSRTQTQPCRLPNQRRSSRPPERKTLPPLPQLLVIDDSASILTTLHELLRHDYEVVTAHGGAEALQLLARSVPDIVLVDWYMPDVGGLAVCASVRASARTRHLPVIMMTGNDTPERRAVGLDSGADDVLAKPFDPDELRARLRTLMRRKQRFEELEAAARLREQLSQMLVHDLRSPLTGVTLALDHLRDADAQDDNAALILRANHDLARANEMLTDLLLIAKIEAGQFEVARAPHAVADLLDEAADGAALVARARGLSVRVEAPRNDAPWRVDRVVVRRVLDNLITNAIKHSTRGQTIVLRAAARADGTPRTDEALQVDVIDQGVGVNPKQRAHLFKRFRSFSQADALIQPIGLGLMFCKLATEAHGGSISYEPNEPCGSVFRVRFRE